MKFLIFSLSVSTAFTTYISLLSPGDTVMRQTALRHGYITSPKEGDIFPFPAASAALQEYSVSPPPNSLNAMYLSPTADFARFVIKTASPSFSAPTNISAYTGCEAYSSPSAIARRS